jgi:hypothetical protein
VSEGEHEGDDWVTIASFDDPVEAEMTCDFLKTHGITLRQLGNAPQVAVLNRFQTIVDIRIAVREADVEEATEALAALRSERRDAHPYRGASEDSSKVVEQEGEGDDRGPKKRTRRAAFALALLLPIGSGHFYAHHGAAAAIVLAGILGGMIATIAGRAPWAFVASAILVAGDALLSPLAVARHNAGKVPSEGKQRVVAAGAVAAAFAIAWLLSREG